MNTMKRHIRRHATVAASAVAAALILFGAVAWACTAHTGSIWFCASSGGCPEGFSVNSPTAGASYWATGASLLADRTDITVRNALTSAGTDACHIGTIMTDDGVTNGSGNLTPISVAMPNPGSATQYTFCATNGTDDNFSNHLTLTVN